MMHCYSYLRRIIPGVLLLLPTHLLLAQAPQITGVLPLANAPAAAPAGPLTITFNQPLAPAAGAALKVFSSQRGGLRTRTLTPATVAGNTLTFNPQAYAFGAGETVQYTITTAATGSGGTLAQPRVGQFVVAVGGAGQADFQYSTQEPCGYTPQAVAPADVDGDGDLDLLVANTNSGTVSVSLNDGRGAFTLFQQPQLRSPTDLSVGDIDGDGDLDFVAASYSSGLVNLRRNYGNGIFSSLPDLSIVGGVPSHTALGDLDGDGDLDLVVSNCLQAGQLLVYSNDGQGNFSLLSSVAIGNRPGVVALGDLDNDGDLDCATTMWGDYLASGYTVNIAYNNGSGSFTRGTDASVGFTPSCVALGDLDNDGDLDLVTCNSYVASWGVGRLAVGLNNGSGVFATASGPALRSTASWVTLGDFDGDHDLDLATSINGYATGAGSYYESLVQLAVNDGQGTFALSNLVGVGRYPSALTMADLDSDGDLDMATTNGLANSLSVNLNDMVLAAAPAQAPAAFSLAPNPAREAVRVEGLRPGAAVQVLDALGQVVLQTVADAGGTAHLGWAQRPASGLYVVQSGRQSQRLVLE